MRKISWIFVTVLFCCSCLTFCFWEKASAAGPDDVLGRWWNQEKEAIIQIYKCSDLFCGKIDWLRNPNYPANDSKGMAGQIKVDRENSDPALRTRPILGLQMLSSLNTRETAAGKTGPSTTREKGKLTNAK